MKRFLTCGKDILNRLKTYRIKSLYIKWVLIFTGLIVIAQLFTFLLTLRFFMPMINESYDFRLFKKAEFVKSLSDKGFDVTEESLTQTGDYDIALTLIDDKTISDGFEKYSDVISLNMIHRAANGEIVSSFLGDRQKPFAIVAIEDKFALLTLKTEGNFLQIAFEVVQKILLISSSIGSLMIVFALRAFIRPIKHVSEATKEVSKGNFNVKLQTKAADEIGQLIRNYNLMAEELQKNDYLKKDFVSSVSHEFKTPITSIEGYTKLLKNEELTENQFNEYTDIIIKETRRLSKLSSNLLQLTLLENSGFEPAKADFFLDEQIRNVILLLENQWDEKNIDFDIEMEEIIFHGNEELLSQVWINLIHNAVKFSPHGGKICVSAKTTNDGAEVVISDHGIGIAPENLDKIFDRFYKADKSRSKDGNGLGLSIVKRIIDLTKGRIFIESNPGMGTKVFVNLFK